MGVCWDPKNTFVATQSCDRTVQIYEVQKGFKQGDDLLKNIGNNFKFSMNQILSPEPKAALNLNSNKPIVSENINKDEEDTEMEFLEKNNAQDKDKNIQTEARIGISGPTNKPPEFKLFHDDNMNSFFRRLEFLPGGEMLLAPSGIFRNSGSNHLNGNSKSLETVYGWTRDCLVGSPRLHLPGHTKATVIVKSCPVTFDREEDFFKNDVKPADFSSRPQGEGDITPGRIIVATASLKDVTIYTLDPENKLSEEAARHRSEAIVFLGDLHYGTITDMAWSSDGMFLLITSSDGFVSIVSFDPSEFGIPFKPVSKKFTESTAFPEMKRQTSVEVLIQNAYPISTADEQPQLKDGIQTIENKQIQLKGGVLAVENKQIQLKRDVLAIENKQVQLENGHEKEGEEKVGVEDSTSLPSSEESNALHENCENTILEKTKDQIFLESKPDDAEIDIVKVDSLTPENIQGGPANAPTAATGDTEKGAAVEKIESGQAQVIHTPQTKKRRIAPTKIG
ncbi:Chromatin assembly factor 1 subunit B [Smittium mucronatum]|uniref:Chromatin assembly factor 1 subunit B n=1 Tax=Smittium mucronatum TaxID=133383 RepID=A0A1R0H7Y4_9FUNG|nr:Chromatin assembly factor 1 subunit B [Smittium mucronatum]